MTFEALGTLVINVGLSGALCLFFVWTQTKRYEALQEFVQRELLGVIERGSTTQAQLASAVDGLAAETRALFAKMSSRPCLWEQPPHNDNHTSPA
jgi:hypothetical protein